MQMSMWVLCCWNRENRMFCHSELSRNCLPGKRSQHTNKWQFLGDYRGFILPKQNSQCCKTQSLSEKPFDLVFLLSRSSGSHALTPVTIINEVVYLKSTFSKSFHDHSTANYADFRDLMTHISCYHFHGGKSHIALKPEVRSAISSVCAMPKSCSRESGWDGESSAKHQETKHKHHRTKAAKNNLN